MVSIPEASDAALWPMQQRLLSLLHRLDRGKGKFGDAGDYAKAASAFLSLEIKGDA